MEEKTYKLEVTGREPMARSKRMRETGGTAAGGTVIVGAMEGLNGKLDKYVFDDLFEKVEISDGKFAIKAKYDFFSVGELAAGKAETDNDGAEGEAEMADALADGRLAEIERRLEQLEKENEELKLQIKKLTT